MNISSNSPFIMFDNTMIRSDSILSITPFPTYQYVDTHTLISFHNTIQPIHSFITNNNEQITIIASLIIQTNIPHNELLQYQYSLQDVDPNQAYNQDYLNNNFTQYKDILEPILSAISHSSLYKINKPNDWKRKNNEFFRIKHNNHFFPMM